MINPRLSKKSVVIGFVFVATLAFALAPEAARSQDLNEVFKQFDQHRQAGQYGEAERLGKQALDLCEARFGRNRPDCLKILNNLAIVYKSQGKYEDAKQLYQRALLQSSAAEKMTGIRQSPRAITRLSSTSMRDRHHSDLGGVAGGSPGARHRCRIC